MIYIHSLSIFLQILLLHFLELNSILVYKFSSFSIISIDAERAFDKISTCLYDKSSRDFRNRRNIPHALNQSVSQSIK